MIDSGIPPEDCMQMRCVAEYHPARNGYPAYWCLIIRGPTFVLEELAKGVALASIGHENPWHKTGPSPVTVIRLSSGEMAKRADPKHPDNVNATALAQAFAAWGVPPVE